MHPSRLIAALFALSPTLGFAQGTVPESALTGQAFSLSPGQGTATPNQNTLGNSGVHQAPTLNAPHPAPGTPGVLIPKRPLAAAAAVPSGADDPIRKAYVQSLQEQLPAHGYRPGPVSGRVDPETERAIHAYQRDAGLQQDARSTWVLKQTIDSVTFARPPIQAAAAAPGGSIAFVQQRLKAKGYDAGPPDGRLGTRTVTAIKDFQGDRGLPRDGKISPQLLDLLRRT